MEKQKQQKNITRQISAGVIVYRLTKEGVKFLLLYHGGSYWNFPKGKIHTEEPETTFKAALRELKEETGLQPKDLQFNRNFKVYDRYIFKLGKEKVFKTVYYYLARTRQPIISISPREHEGYGWFLYRDAVKMLRHQNLKNNLKKSFDLIRGIKPQVKQNHR